MDNDMITTWPTMVESAEWYAERAIASFKRRHDNPCFGGNPRSDARYNILCAKRQREKVKAAGERAFTDPW